MTVAIPEEELERRRKRAERFTDTVSPTQENFFNIGANELGDNNGDYFGTKTLESVLEDSMREIDIAVTKNSSIHEEIRTTETVVFNEETLPTSIVNVEFNVDAINTDFTLNDIDNEKVNVGIHEDIEMKETNISKIISTSTLILGESDEERARKRREKFGMPPIVQDCSLKDSLLAKSKRKRKKFDDDDDFYFRGVYDDEFDADLFDLGGKRPKDANIVVTTNFTDASGLNYLSSGPGFYHQQPHQPPIPMHHYPPSNDYYHHLHSVSGGVGVPGVDLDLMMPATRVEKHEPKAGCSVRTDAIHLFGVDNLQTSQLLHYFGEYEPSHVEWINDSSCNVVWSGDNLTPKRALLSMGIPVHINRIGGNPASGHHYTLVKMNSPSDPFDLLWRAGPCVPGTKFRLIMRFATSCDSTKIDNKRGGFNNPNNVNDGGDIRISTRNHISGGGVDGPPPPPPRLPREFELLYGYSPNNFDLEHGASNSLQQPPPPPSSGSKHNLSSRTGSSGALDNHRNFEKNRFDADTNLDSESNLVNTNNNNNYNGEDDISSIYMEIDKYKRRSKQQRNGFEQRQ